MPGIAWATVCSKLPTIMIKTLLCRSGVILAAGLFVLQTAAAEPAMIAKARAYLGGDTVLSNVSSIHYQGKLFLAAADPAKAPEEVGVDIIFQKPDRQRSVLTAEKRIEITALDGYEAWQKVEDPKDPTRWTMNLLGPDQIKSLRANAWENLSFFRGLEGRRGTIEDLGTVTADGVACRKLAFVHSPEVAFYRYFDEATGRLVLTETAQGESIREEGLIMAGGVKFPQTLVTTMRQPDGSALKITIRFEKITVNETFADSLFAVPSFGFR